MIKKIKNRLITLSIKALNLKIDSINYNLTAKKI